jgi:hypothetical protein
MLAMNPWPPLALPFLSFPSSTGWGLIENGRLEQHFLARSSAFHSHLFRPLLTFEEVLSPLSAPARFKYDKTDAEYLPVKWVQEV